MKRTLKFVLLTSLAFGVTYGISTLIDGLFLEQVGSDGLPAAYFLTSIVCLLCAMLTLRALTNLPVRRIFVVFTSLGVAFYLGATLCLWQGMERLPTLFWYIYKIGCLSFCVMMYTHLWSFVDHCFEGDQASRLYGLFNASTLLGASGGAGLVSLLVCHLAPSLIFAIFGILLAVVVALALTTQESTANQEGKEHDQPRITLPVLMREIFKSRFVVCLLTFNTLMLFLEVVTEYNYLASLQSVFFNETSGALTQFIGRVRGCVFFGMTIFGMFFYGRMISWMGLRNAITLPAFYFVLLFLSWLTGHGLILGVFGLIGVEGVLAGLEDNNFNLMVNSVDSRLKAKLRVTAEQVLEPGAMLASSSLLMICQSHSKILGLCLSCTALVAVFLLRAAFPASVRARRRHVPLLQDVRADTRVPQNVA